MCMSQWSTEREDYPVALSDCLIATDISRMLRLASRRADSGCCVSEAVLLEIFLYQMNFTKVGEEGLLRVFDS